MDTTHEDPELVTLDQAITLARDYFASGTPLAAATASVAFNVNGRQVAVDRQLVELWENKQARLSATMPHVTAAANLAPGHLVRLDDGGGQIVVAVVSVTPVRPGVVRVVVVDLSGVLLHFLYPHNECMTIMGCLPRGIEPNERVAPLLVAIEALTLD